MWKFLFSPKGRVSRKAIWLKFLLPQIAVVIVATIIDMAAGWYDEAVEVGVLSGLASLFYVWPNIAVSVKRFHDRNMTGWWILYFFGLAIVAIGLGVGAAALLKVTENPLLLFLFLIPTIALVIAETVILYFLPGTRGENRFGPDPREAA